MRGTTHLRWTRSLAAVLLLVLPTTVNAQAPANRAKLDAMLRAALSGHQVGPVPAPGRAEVSALDRAKGVLSGPAGAVEPWVRVLVKGDRAAEAVRAVGGAVGAVLGPVATARLPLSALGALADRPEVEFIEASTPHKPALDEAVAGANAANLYGGSYNLSGAGVLVGIYDSGIDYTHGDFITSGGSTRIVSLWDQTLDDASRYPSPFIYGSEWTQTELDDEIDGSPASLVTQTDSNGHGTHVAGIAAGNGLAASKYPGLARGADLVVIKGGNGSFSSADIIDGLYYFFARADALAMPGVINLSLGGHGGPHDGKSAYEAAIDNAVGTGKVVVVSAGNEGNDDIHDRRSLTAAYPGNLDSFQVTVESYTPNTMLGNDYFDLNIWYEGTSSVDVTMVAPGGTRYGPYVSGTVDGGDSVHGYFYVDNAQFGVDVRNNDKHLFVEVWDGTAGQEPVAGTWWVVLEETSGNATAVDTWVSDWSMPTWVTNTVPDYSVGHPGTAFKALTVGAWVTRTDWTSIDTNSYHYTTANEVNEIAAFSSWGPTRDGRLKPDIAAPGQGIFSALSTSMTYPGDPWVDVAGYHRLSQGTSQAAPVVTGVVALLLETDPTLTADEVKQHLHDTASTDTYTGTVPSNEWGYGKLDAQTAVDAVLAATAGTPTVTLYAPTGVQQGSVVVSYHLEDDESDPIDLTVEYSDDYGASWYTATTSGLTTGITSAEYDSFFVWLSDIDLYPFAASQVWLRATPDDGATGTADTTRFALDNQAPESIDAAGDVGAGTVVVWFDEKVDLDDALIASNYALQTGSIVPTAVSHYEEWAEETELPYWAWGAGGVVIDGEPWYFGGVQGVTAQSYLYRLDLGTSTWESRASMPTARYEMAYGVIDGQLYVAGGRTGTGTYTDVLEIYDPDTNSWTTGAPIPSSPNGRSGMAAGVLEGRLYLVGGEKDEVYYNDTWIYDPATDAWSSPGYFCPVSVHRAVSGVIGGQLYLAGGYAASGASDALVVFDPDTNGWSTLAAMPAARYFAAGGAPDGHLYVAGGQDSGGGETATLFAYDPDAGTWRTAEAMPTTRYMGVAIALDGQLYVAGGSDGEFETQLTSNLEFDSQAWFELELPAGETLPATDVQVAAWSIPDLYGNYATDLEITFTPYTLTPPSVILRQPTGTRSGDVTFHYEIEDPEGDTVGLLLEYSTNGSTWQSATVAVPPDTSGIQPLDYHNAIIWASGDDLGGQEWDKVWVRITPNDGSEAGTPAQTFLHLDNQPPQWLEGHGEPGDRTKIRFWYDEPVDLNATRNVNRYNIPEGLTIQSIMRRDAWRLVDETVIPTARVSATIAVIDGKVYVAGGRDALNNKLDLLEIYDPDTETWSPGASLPEARVRAAGGVIDGKWYLAGGASPSGNLNTVIVYDPDTDTWSGGLSTMNIYRAGCRGAVVDGRLYVLGGDALTQSAVERYDPKTDTWETQTPYTVPRHSAVIGVIDDFIYLAGGYDNSSLRSELEVYDPQNDSWTTLAPLPEGRTDAAGGVLSDRLVVAGGLVFEGLSTDVRIYTPDSDTWWPAASTASMPEGRSGANSIIQDEKLYVAGGQDDEDNLVTSILEFDLQARYEAQLAPGESLPDNSVTLEAADILDLYGNSQLSISTDILPYELSAHISGTAYDANPNLIEGMRLLLRPTGEIGWGGWIDTTYTDSSGEYWFDVAPGTYEIVGQKIQGINYYETAYLDSFAVELGQTYVKDLDITRGPTFGVANIQINGTGTTDTVSTGDAVSVSMEFVAWNDQVTPSVDEWLTLGLGSAGYAGYSLGVTPVYPGASGTATFNFNAPTTGGIYTVYVKRAASTTEAGALLRYNARFWNVDWEYIPVGTLTVVADGEIAGTVFEPDTSQPIPNAKVRLRPHGSTAWSDSTVTGSDGTYSFAVSAGSDYNIFAEAVSGSRYLSSKPEDVVNAGVTTNYDPLEQGVGYGFELVSLDLAATGRDSINLQPGGSLLGTLTLRTWDAWEYGGDVYLLIGIGGGAQDLDYRVVTAPGNYTGTSGNIALDLQAPGTSGTYSIYVVLDRDGIPTSDDYEDRFPFDQEFAFLPVGTVVVDGTAPTPATGLDMGGSDTATSAWTNDDTEMRVWFDAPDDPSGIAGVRFKLVAAGETDEPPQDETQITDTAAVSYDSGKSKWYFDLVLTGRVNDGSNHLYFWLADGAFNYSYTQWAEGWINFDATGPTQPTLLTPNSSETVATQRPTFTWTSSDDAGLSGIDYYVVQVGTNSSLGEIVHENTVNSATLSYTATEDIPNGSYFWAVHAVDVVGNQSSWIARQIIISAATMDQPVLVSVTGGDWSNQDVTTLSWNAVSGASQYFLQLTIGTDTGFAATFYENSTSSTSMGVGVSGRGDGEYLWRVRAESGLDFSPWSETTFRLDRQAPDIGVDALPGTIDVGSSVQIAGTFNDINGLDDVRLYYRSAGFTTAFIDVVMTQQAGDRYTGTIPGSAVTINGFQYAVRAVDPAGNIAFADADGSVDMDTGVVGSAPVRIADLPASGTIPRDQWYMISVPHNPDDARITAVLPDLPNADPKVWRFFRWTGTGYQEETSSSLQPGRAYWFQHRREGIQLDPGSGQTISAGQPFQITLSPGWNDIGSPWLFNVAWTDIMTASGLSESDVSRPYGFSDGDWVLPPTIGELPVWFGISVYNHQSSNVALLVPPSSVSGEQVSTARTVAEYLAEQGTSADLPVGRVEEEGVSGWRLQLVLTQEGALVGDRQNYLGVLSGHGEGWDPADLPDPPMAIDGSARLMVDRTRRADHRGGYAADYQGTGEPGYEWPLRVESVQGGRRATVGVHGVGGLPDGYVAALVDVRSNLRIDLTEGRTYRFFPGAAAGQQPVEGMAVEHTFRLVAGSAAFVDARTAGTIRLPAEASLDQNFPNPFNPTTTVRFALAEPAQVHLTVLNVRGQRVATLADGLFNAGPHTVTWDGRDATGRPAASGIYFYRLEAAGKVISKKMTLIR